MRLELRAPEAAFYQTLRTTPTPELLPALRRLLVDARPAYPGSHVPAVLTYAVADQLYDRGVYVEALPLLREALAEQAENKYTVTALSKLGTCLSGLQQYAEALPLLERALAYSTRLKGEESEETLSDLRATATARMELGDLVGAEALLQRGWATQARLAIRAGLPAHAPPPGQLSHWALFALALARLFQKQRRFDDAEALLRKSQASLAAAPVCEASTRCEMEMDVELASVLFFKGDLLGAEKLFRSWLPKLHGRPNYGITAMNLGLVLQKRGLVTESRKYLDIGRQAIGESNGARNNLTHSSQMARSELDAPLRSCARCGPVTDAAIVMKVCSVCKAARYCGPACQKLHWKAHKPECKRIAAESEQVAGSGAAGPSGA